MVRYLARACPQCKGYLGVVIPGQKPLVPAQIYGRCAICGHAILVRGKKERAKNARASKH